MARSNTFADQLIKGEITFEEYKRRMLVGMAQCIYAFVHDRVRTPRRYILKGITTYRDEVNQFLDESEDFDRRISALNDITERDEDGFLKQTGMNYNEDFMSFGLLHGYTYEYMDWAHKYGKTEEDRNFSHIEPSNIINLLKEIGADETIQLEAFRKLKWDTIMDFIPLSEQEVNIVTYFLIRFSQAVEKLCKETGNPDRNIGMLLENMPKLSCFNEKGLFTDSTGECREPEMVQLYYADDLMDKVPKDLNEFLENDDNLRKYRDCLKEIATNSKRSAMDPSSIKKSEDLLKEAGVEDYKKFAPSRFDLIKKSAKDDKEYKRILKLCKQRGID